MLIKYFSVKTNIVFYIDCDTALQEFFATHAAAEQIAAGIVASAGTHVHEITIHDMHGEILTRAIISLTNTELAQQGKISFPGILPHDYDIICFCT